MHIQHITTDKATMHTVSDSIFVWQVTGHLDTLSASESAFTHLHTHLYTGGSVYLAGRHLLIKSAIQTCTDTLMALYWERFGIQYCAQRYFDMLTSTCAAFIIGFL